MQKEELSERLKNEYAAFVAAVQQLSESQQQRQVPGKWSPAQIADHLNRSLSPVVLAFRLPRFVLRLLFGKANRPSRSYGELVTKYQNKLMAGAQPSGRFAPPPQVVLGPALARLIGNSERLARRMAHFSEAQLDYFILPHPLLGKLTLREMLYFTAYHAHHHRIQIG